MASASGYPTQTASPPLAPTPPERRLPTDLFASAPVRPTPDAPRQPRQNHLQPSSGEPSGFSPAPAVAAPARPAEPKRRDGPGYLHHREHLRAAQRPETPELQLPISTPDQPRPRERPAFRHCRERFRAAERPETPELELPEIAPPSGPRRLDIARLCGAGPRPATCHRALSARAPTAEREEETRARRDAAPEEDRRLAGQSPRLERLPTPTQRHAGGDALALPRLAAAGFFSAPGRAQTPRRTLATAAQLGMQKPLLGK